MCNNSQSMIRASRPMLRRGSGEREGFVLVHVGPVPWNDDTNDGPARVSPACSTRHPTFARRRRALRRARLSRATPRVCRQYPESFPRYHDGVHARFLARLPTPITAFVEVDRRSRRASAPIIPNTPHELDAADMDGFDRARTFDAATLRKITQPKTPAASHPHSLNHPHKLLLCQREAVPRRCACRRGSWTKRDCSSPRRPLTPFARK